MIHNVFKPLQSFSSVSTASPLLTHLYIAKYFELPFMFKFDTELKNYIKLKQ